MPDAAAGFTIIIEPGADAEIEVISTSVAPVSAGAGVSRRYQIRFRYKIGSPQATALEASLTGTNPDGSSIDGLSAPTVTPEHPTGSANVFQEGSVSGSVTPTQAGFTSYSLTLTIVQA